MSLWLGILSSSGGSATSARIFRPYGICFDSKNNQEPTQIMVMKWLESYADKYLERSNELTEYRGLKLIDEKSLLQIEG